MKKFLIKIRTSLKFFILVSIATLMILGMVVLLYKPIYSVSLNGELIGYCENKSKLQNKISDYVENGDGENNNLAFVSIDAMPTYKLCLLKRGITTNDDEIFEKVTEKGTAYYKYFAVLDDDEEKVYVSKFDEAEKIVKKLKDKNSNNIDDITIKEKYETELEDFVSEEKAVSKLYEKKIVKVKKTQEAHPDLSAAISAPTYTTSNSSGTLKLSNTISNEKVNIGISLIKPVTGTITSRFASMSRVRTSVHKGLDIGAPQGTTIKAAAGGKVVYDGVNGGWGNLVVISHGNGVQTYYAHCSKIYVSLGQKVSQGEKIAAVGETGNATGPHLHLEVRINGVAYNPQNYVY